MRRRTYLASTASLITLTAGCQENSNSDADYQGIDDPDDSLDLGLAPDPIEVPDRDIDEDRFETYNTSGKTIQLVPLDVAYYWYNTHKARIVDARVRDQYEEARIEGAVHSPAPNGNGNELADISENERIVTYCVCPYHLASERAASLMDSGHSGVYGLVTGMEGWLDKGYTMSGTNHETIDFEGHEEDYSNLEDHDYE